MDENSNDLYLQGRKTYLSLIETKLTMIQEMNKIVHSLVT